MSSLINTKPRREAREREREREEREIQRQKQRNRDRQIKGMKIIGGEREIGTETEK